MAQSHQGALYNKALCSIFLSSVMVLAGCSNRQPASESPPPLEPDATYDITQALKTGEENFDTAISFKNIQRDGDLRIRRIIARMRMSSVGEEMFQFAVKNDIEFQWEEGVKTRKGAYHYGINRITVDALHSDDGVLSTLSHEIRHAWQDKILDVTRWVLEPADHWRASQMIEADSCAYNAHFVANYNDETLYMLDLKNSFSQKVTRGYAEKPASERNYMDDGLDPCLNIVLRPYSTLHMSNLREYLSRNTMSFNEAATSRTYKMVYKSGFETLDIHRKSALFMRFVNNTLDSETILPEAKQMTAENFLGWIKERTPFRTPEDEEEVMMMENDFRAVRQKLINALH